MAAFGKRKGQAQEKYQQFVTEGKGYPSPWQSLRKQVFPGSEQFVEVTRKKIEDGKDLSVFPDSQRRPPPLALEAYHRKASTRDEAITMAYASGVTA